MSDSQENPSVAESPAENPAEELHESETNSSLLEFFRALPKLLSVTVLNESIRITPHGLFVEQSSVDSIVSLYRTWLLEKTNGEVNKSEQKVMKRLFGSLEPALNYLVESKRCFVGYIVSVTVPQPQQLGLPFYLGSLDDATKTIHPRDPFLMCLPHLDMKQTPQGPTYSVTLESGRVSFSLSLLESFTRLARHSAWLSKKLPGESAPLRDGLKVMLEIVQRAKLVPPKERVLIPVAAQIKRGYKIYRSGGLYFLAEPSGLLVLCYEPTGRGLYHFIRTECAKLFSSGRDRRVASCELLPNREKAIGVFHPGGKKYPLMPHALLQFIEAVQGHPGKGATANDWFSVRDALSEFSDEFLRSERIEASKIERHIEANAVRADSYRMFERWIFFISKHREIVGCSDRFHVGEKAKRPAGRRNTFHHKDH